MGSDSDLPVMQEAAKFLDECGVSYEITVVSAHRTPKRLYDYATTAERRGLKLIIAGAGGAAHLPGMVASLTPLPVIGVPVKSSTMRGIDSLFSIAQMPPGIPVATVAINGARNAGILAVEMLGIEDKKFRAKISRFKQGLEKMVIEKAGRLEKDGFKKYLSAKD